MRWERQLVEALLLVMEERKKLEVKVASGFVLELEWGRKLVYRFLRYFVF